MPRLFFALWPDNNTRNQLQAITQPIPQNCGRVIPAENLHITLAFLGQIDEETAKNLEAAAMQIKAREFTLELSTIGYWRKAKILWLAPAVIPAELNLLVARVNEISIVCGITLDGRPFRPHITLARKAGMAAPQIQNPLVSWQVRNFALVESVTHHIGAQYRVRRSWNLLN